MKPNHRKLKNFIINPVAQGRFIRPFLALVIGLCLIVAITYWHIVSSLESKMEEARTMNAQSFRLLEETLGRMSTDFTIGFVVMFVAGVLIAIVCSHRLYGAAFTLERRLDEMIAGKYDRHVRLRPADELHGIADKVNALSDRLAAGTQLTNDRNS